VIVMRRVALPLLVIGLIAVAIWLPRQDDAVVVETAESLALDLPPAVEFRATRGQAEAPFTERWDLGFPDTATPSQTVTLQLGPVEGTTAPARLTAAPGGNPAELLSRVAVVLGGGAPATDPAAVTALDLRLDLLGDTLSVGHAEDGATVIAGAFLAQPAGSWRVYRVAFGTAPTSPQCFLGISEATRAAVLLLRAVEDGPAIESQIRALLPRTNTT
jgi:hypothetical protein